ncbi:hypothetical protein [Halovivax limisalsi]|uniref:hypothetical protein n=1 Tax=Halovivax limisalsi TaxID=1453760 RepID=UPI001FFD68DD|nr:hypothetical protein [Halovivax limisalsi]
MGGWRRTGGSASVDQLESVLEAWEYGSSPTPAAALASFLRERYPDAAVERPGRAEAADVVVDGVAVLFAAELGQRFRTQFHVLADRYDAVVCYSIGAHRDDPTEWRAFTRRFRGETIRFVRRPEPEPNSPGLAGPITVAAVPLVMAAITIVLAASTGLFATSTGPLTADAGLVLGAVALGAIATAISLFELARQRQLGLDTR